MAVAQVIALLGAGQQLVAAGSATIAQLKAFYRTLHPGLTDEDMNALLDAIAVGAARHKLLADADIAAGGG